MSGCSLSVSISYSNVTDKEFDAVLRDILIGFPKTGYRRMLGHMKKRGTRVQDKRVRTIFHRVNLEGAIKCYISLRTIQERKYNVKGFDS